MSAKTLLIIFVVIFLLTLLMVGWLGWKGYQLQKGEVLISTDKTEYEPGGISKVKIQNNFGQNICFSSCYPYYLEHKNKTWESYKYVECQRLNGNGYCIKAGDLKAFELTLPQDIKGLHRLAIPVCIGCKSEDTFREDKRFYSNEFMIKEKKVGDGTCPSVSYDGVIQILNRGEVKSIFQFHNLGLSILLKDGRCISTKQPVIDDIIQKIKECGELCKDVLFGTE